MFISPLPLALTGLAKFSIRANRVITGSRLWCVAPDLLSSCQEQITVFLCEERAPALLGGPVLPLMDVGLLSSHLRPAAPPASLGGKFPSEVSTALGSNSDNTQAKGRAICLQQGGICTSWAYRGQIKPARLGLRAGTRKSTGMHM